MIGEARQNWATELKCCSLGCCSKSWYCPKILHTRSTEKNPEVWRQRLVKAIWGCLFGREDFGDFSLVETLFFQENFTKSNFGGFGRQAILKFVRRRNYGAN